MSLKTIQLGISQALSGKDCKLCEKYGVTCHDVGLLDGAPGNAGETVIYVAGEAKMRTYENINSCDAVLGKHTNRQVATEIKKKAKRLEGVFDLSNLKIGNN